MRKRSLTLKVSTEQLDMLENLINSSLEERSLDVLGVLEILGIPCTVVDGRLRVGVKGEETVTVSEAAEYLGVTVGRVRQLLTESPPRLLGRKVGGAWLVSFASVRKYAEKSARG